MNRRHCVIVSLSIVFGVAAIYWIFHQGVPLIDRSNRTTTADSMEDNGARLTLETQSRWRQVERNDPLWSNAWYKHQMDESWLEDPAARRAVEAQRQDRNWKWKQPINFWGVILDQDNEPIPGARVRFGWTDLSSSGNSERFVESDASGFVALEGQTGYVMGVRVSKPGYYEFEDSLLTLNYAEPWDLDYHKPDPERPIILRLRKKGECEELIHGIRMIEFTVPANTNEIVINLLKQASVSVDADSDFRVRIAHGPAIKLDGRRRFDWRIELEASDGGWIVTDERFPFLAPETGYVPKLTFSADADASSWQGGMKGRFYLRSRNGRHFARMRLSIAPFPVDGSPSVQITDFYLNPNGSRNLEYDPEKDVTEKYKYGPE